MVGDMHVWFRRSHLCLFARDEPHTSTLKDLQFDQQRRITMGDWSRCWTHACDGKRNLIDSLATMIMAVVDVSRAHSQVIGVINRELHFQDVLCGVPRSLGARRTDGGGREREGRARSRASATRSGSSCRCAKARAAEAAARR